MLDSVVGGSWADEFSHPCFIDGLEYLSSLDLTVNDSCASAGFGMNILSTSSGVRCTRKLDDKAAGCLFDCHRHLCITVVKPTKTSSSLPTSHSLESLPIQALALSSTPLHTNSSSLSIL